MLRLIVFALVAARGVRIVLVHFYRCNCISMTVCCFIEKYSSNCIFFCKYLLLGFKIVRKVSAPWTETAKKVSAPCFKAIKKCLPHGLSHRPHAPNKFCPVPYFWRTKMEVSKHCVVTQNVYVMQPYPSL